MKRSEINRALRDVEKMIDRCSSKLPPFYYFTPEEWKEKGREYDEVRDNMLGWDITGFGMGGLDRADFSSVILRNGDMSVDKYTKPHAEKPLYMKEGQFVAMHFYQNRMENTIDRGGGNMFIGVYSAGKEGDLADTDVLIHSDGWEYTTPAETQVRLCPGESIAIQSRLYHDFHLELGVGLVLLGEMSMYNDDNRGNQLYLPVDRLPVIEEDRPSFRLLYNKYSPADSCAKR